VTVAAPTLVECRASTVAFDGRHLVDDDDFCGRSCQHGGDVMCVVDGLLESRMGTGAAMAGRAMLAARRI